MAELKKDTQEMLDIADVSMGKHTGSDFDRMTPDDAYRQSVATTGRAPGITDNMDAAASIPEDTLQRTRQRVTAPAMQTPPQYGERVTRDANGNVTASVQRFGGKYVSTDQKTGKQTWYEQGADGKFVETAAPKSMQIMDAMNAGYSPNAGTATSWEDAIAKQKAQRAERSFAIAQQKSNENNKILSTRRQRQVRQNLKVADTLASATANLGANLADVQTHIRNGESIDDSGAYLSKDGNYYVRGIVAPSMVDAFNREMGGLGATDALQKIVVSQQINKTTGEPIGEPMFAALYLKDGIASKGSGVYTKQLTLSEALRSVAKAYRADGQPTESINSYLAGVFGAENAAKYGYAPNRDVKFEIEALRQMGLNQRADAKNDMANKKLEFQYRQLEANIQKALSAAKSADERNAIIKQAKEAELQLRQQEIESKYAQMGVQYGSGETRKSAQQKIGDKLMEHPGGGAETAGAAGGAEPNPVSKPTKSARPTNDEWAKMTREQKRAWLRENAASNAE